MIRRPWLVLLIALLLAGAAGLAVSRLRMDTSLASLFDKQNPSARALVRVMDDSRSAEELLILTETPADAPPAPHKLLDFAKRLSQSIEADPVASKQSAGVIYSASPQVRSFFEKVLVPHGLFYLDDATLAAAKQRLTRAEMEQQIRRDEEMIATPGPAAGAMSKLLLKDPLRLHEFLMGRLAAGRPFHTYQNSDAFLSADGRALLIRIRGSRPVSDLEFSKAFTSRIETLAGASNQDHLHLSFSGAYAIAAASASAIRSDMIASVIGSIIALQLLFMLAYRRPVRSFVLAFVPVAIGTLYGFGAYAVLRGSLTPMTAAIGGILAGMAIDYAIAYLSYYQAQRARLNASEAARATRRGVGTAILAAWATSVMGFIAIAWSNTPALRDFAILGGLGLTGAFLAAIFILPAVLVLVDRRASSARAVPRLPAGAMLRVVARSRRVVFAIVAIIFVAAAVGLCLPGEILPMESDLSVMHPRPNPPLDAQQRIAQKMGASPGTMVVYLHAQTADALQHLACEVDRRLNSPAVKEAGVTGTFGLGALLPDPNLAAQRRASAGPGYADRVVADFRSVVAGSIFDPQAFAPYEGFLRQLLTAKDAPTIEDLLHYPALADNILPASAFSDRAKPPNEAITLVFLSGGTETRQSRDAAVNAIRSALGGLDGAAAGAQSATLTGLSVLSHDVELSIRRELPRLVLAAVIVAGIYLVLHFRNLADCVLAMLPSIFSLVCLLAWMRLTGAKLNMVNLAAFPLLVGIDVDYGIFLVSAARSARRTGMAQNRMLEDLSPAAGAVIMCGASTLLGFGSLAFTSIPAVRSLGWAVVVGVIGCVIGTFCLTLPLMMMRRRGAARTPPPVSGAISPARIES